MTLKVIDGRRDELVEQEIQALTRFVCSDDTAEARKAYKEAVAIDQRTRPRGTLRLVSTTAKPQD